MDRDVDLYHPEKNRSTGGDQLFFLIIHVWFHSFHDIDHTSRKSAEILIDAYINDFVEKSSSLGIPFYSDF